MEALKRTFNLWFPTRSEGNPQGLGTFSGVYLPSILPMLGVILFMRLGWITGHIGLPKMTLIILMASSILFFTGLSMTSIVTNMKMGSGGSYYIISRSLGMSFGSAIGILLSLAQLITIAICVSGFAISLQEILPHLSLSLLELCTLGGLALVGLFPTSFALRTQGVIFTIVALSILSVFFGSADHIPETISPAPVVEAISFWAAFALFFPATTGIESGMAMSGDLKNPARSLPIGTLAAVLTAYLVYVSLSLFLSMNIPKDLLRSHPMIIYHTSKVGALFILGVWGATLSSALGSMISSPRTLQSLAKDGIFPSFFSKSPRRASLLIVGLATAMTLLTDMNHLLPILSMVCLMTYGLLNFVSFFETLLKNPSWRPLFKTPLVISLAGTIACAISMFMINAGWAFTVLLAALGLCIWTARRNLKGNWNDIRYSILSFFVGAATSRLVHLQKNPRSWRPNLLAIVDPNLQNQGVIAFSNYLNQAKGFLTYGTTLPQKETILSTQETFNTYFQKEDIPCFFHINAHPCPFLGTQNIIQNYGLGPLKPNTIVLSAEVSDTETFCSLICAAYEQQKNVILLKTKGFQNKKTINLWWGGKYHSNFELSLALAHILQSGKHWPKASIVIKTVVSSKASEIHMTKLFEKYHAALRFDNLSFHPYITDSTDFYHQISEHSADGDLTFLGLRAPLPDEPLNDYANYYRQLMASTTNVDNIAYVLAGEPLNFQEIFE